MEFTRNELEIIMNEIDNIEIKNKIKNTIESNSDFIKKFKIRFSEYNLLLIEKCSTENVYYIYFLEDEDEDVSELAMHFVHTFNKKNRTCIDIHIIEHETLDEFWHYGGDVVFVRNDISKKIL